jgi:hypothetical protein
MRIAAAGLLLLTTASMSVGCVSERTVSTAPMAGYLREGSGPAPAVQPAIPSPSPAAPRGAAEGGDAQQTREPAP